MNLAEKAELIRQANRLEEMYAEGLQNPNGLVGVLTELRSVAVDAFLGEIIKTYDKRRKEGQYAVRASFPVPPLEEMKEHENGSVSFVQAYCLEWSRGEVQEQKSIHTYYFDEGSRRIVVEEGAGRMFAGDRE